MVLSSALKADMLFCAFIIFVDNRRKNTTFARCLSRENHIYRLIHCHMVTQIRRLYFKTAVPGVFFVLDGTVTLVF